MKSLTPALAVIVAFLALAVNLRSQAVAAKPPLEQLKAIRAKNIEIIEKQKQTLLKLDEMDKQADQIRVLAKRS